MKLIVVTTPTFFVEEDKIITALFEEGLDVLHLRKPETPAMYSERLLTLIPDKYHRRIVTHEHFYLKEEFNLMGIHLNARNPKEPHDYYGHISCSCHSVEEVKNRKHFYDYVFMSPIYDSISKVNYYSTYTAEELREAQRAKIIDSKVMALGGINEDNLLEIKDFGFGGAVVLGDLWNKFDACQDQNYLAVIEHFKKLKKLSEIPMQLLHQDLHQNASKHHHQKCRLYVLCHYLSQTLFYRQYHKQNKDLHSPPD